MPDFTAVSSGVPDCDVAYPSPSPSVEDMARALERWLQRSPLAVDLKEEAAEEIGGAGYSATQLPTALPKVFDALGIQRRLRAAIWALHRTAHKNAEDLSRPDPEPLDPLAPAVPPLPRPVPDSCGVLAAARLEWRRFLLGKLTALQAQAGVPFAQRRTPETESRRQYRCALQDRFLSRYTEMPDSFGDSGDNVAAVLEPEASPGLCVERSLFQPTDLLRHIAAIANPNHSGLSLGLTSWGVVQLELAVPDLPELRRRFAQLSPQYCQSGMEEAQRDLLDEERVRVCDLLLQRQHLPHLRLFSQRGIPASQRPRVWKQLLNVCTGADWQQHFSRLQGDVQAAETFIDDVVRWEVFMARNNASFFPFEEPLEAALLLFHRDPTMAEEVHNLGWPLFTATTACGVTNYPPNGVIPHCGIALLMAPLCYLYGDLSDLLIVWRTMYLQYWAPLYTLTLRPGSILSVCRLFETLTQARCPQAVYHCLALGIPPLSIVFPWLCTAFAGALPPDQTLTLWDRILAFDRVELLAVLAAALFAWRAPAVASCETAEEVHHLFSDNSKILVVPLLQHFLFG
eukprot:EG_transcript_7148